MSQIAEGPTRQFIAGAALGECIRVKLSSGKLAACANTEGPTASLGQMERPSFADGDRVAVRLRNAQGTARFVADGAISSGALVYPGASGKISATQTSTTPAVGTALEAAAADGDIIEVLPV